MLARIFGGALESEEFIVLVKIPTGSRNKYEYDPALGGIVLDRRLFTSMSYPADYGFIEGTLGEDGDPLDALVLVGDPTFPGCRVRARPVGVFYMTDEKGSDEKIICSSLHDPAWLHVHDIDDLQPEYRDEIEHFFQVYKDLEKKKTATEGFGTRAEAIKVIEAARRRAREAGSAGLG
jgi:inorganic pyrophosphatase